MTSIIDVDVVLKNQRHRNYVPPISDGDVGWRAFFAGVSVGNLRNATQRQAWKEAATAATLHPSKFSQGDDVEVMR